MQNFSHISILEYYVFLHLTKNSDVDERGHRLRFFHTPWQVNATEQYSDVVVRDVQMAEQHVP